jgi:hypothetical protein
VTDPPILDRSVPVSREDYDRMADQRDRFRAALVEAESALTEVLNYVDMSDEDAYLCDHDSSAEAVRSIAQRGFDDVKKALKSG